LNVSAYERHLRPEEESFHDVLQNHMADVEGQQGEVYIYKRAGDDTELTAHAYMYQDLLPDPGEKEHEGANGGFGMALGRLGAGGSGGGGAGIFSSLRTRGRGDGAGLADSKDARIERDLWKLLAFLTEHGLIRQGFEALPPQSELLSSEPIASEPNEALHTVLERALTKRLRLKKGRALQTWLQDCARHGVDLTIAPTENMKSIRNRDPDAQLTSDGNLKPLDGAEGADQERLLQSIWQLIRCGEVSTACERAYSEGYAWLAASIRGCAVQEADADSEEVREGFGSGNTQQPMWVMTAWKYAERLRNGTAGTAAAQHMGMRGLKRGLGNVGRRGTGAGRLEMAIFGSLSDNTLALEGSGQLVSWWDRVWSLVKASHDLDMAVQAAAHRRYRSSCSSLYPGCDQDTIAREREWMEYVETSTAPVDLWDCEELFRREPPPGPMLHGAVEDSSDVSALHLQNALLVDPSVGSHNPLPLQDNSAEQVLTSLEAAIMGGGSMLVRHLLAVQFHVVGPLRSALLLGTPGHDACFFAGYARVLRVYAHLALWLASARDTCPQLALALDASGASLANFVSAYAYHLLRHGQGALVPTYCAAMWSHEESSLRAPSCRGPLACASLDIAVALVVGHTVDTGEGTTTGEAREKAASRFSELLREALPPAAVVEVLVRAVRALLYNKPLQGVTSVTGSDTYAASPSSAPLPPAPRQLNRSPVVPGSAIRPRKSPKVPAPQGTTGSIEWRLRAVTWLSRPDEPQHRADCIKESNSYLFSTAADRLSKVDVQSAGGGVIALLADNADSFMVQLRGLMTGIISKDSLHIAETSFNTWCSQLEPSTGEAGAETRVDLSLSLWSEQRRHRLWRSLHEAYRAVREWAETLAQHRSLLQELQGGNVVIHTQMQRVVPALNQAATAAFDALQAVLTLEENADAPELYQRDPMCSEQISSGISQVLGAAEILLMRRCKRAFAGRGAGFDDSALGVDLSPQEVAGVQPEMASTEDWQEAKRDVQQAFLGHADKHRLDAFFADLSSAAVPPAVAAATLARCRKAIQELERDRRVVGSVAELVVRVMTEVCLLTAQAVEAVHADTCSDWCKRCVRMASLVASENPETLLYRLISHEALRTMLGDVQNASLKLLELCKGSAGGREVVFDVREGQSE